MMVLKGIERRSLFAFTFAICMFLCGCDASKSTQGGDGEPKTVYGQAIKKTKDVGAKLETDDDEVAKQAKDLFEE